MEVPMEAAMPSKKEIHSSTRKLGAELNASHKVPKKNYGCTVESHESTRQRVEPSPPQNHEEHIAGKGYTSMTHYNFGSQVYSYATSDENFGCSTTKRESRAPR